MKMTTKILIIVCILGLSLFLYPSFSNYWNSQHATGAISTYRGEIDTITSEKYQQIWEEAVAYNRTLNQREDVFRLAPELRESYYSLLDPSGTGVMGYVDISKLGVSLPIYHGTSDAVLQRAVGHLEWSSLPVGGESTHCVISGHRGLPSAKLFTDLNKLREGDTFTLMVLNEVMTYEVDQIRTVLPNDVSELSVRNGKDYCTLVTCTPYGINTHRLLIRGHRVETLDTSDARVVSEAVLIEPLVVAPIVAFPILFAMILYVLLKKPPKKKSPADPT